jgi:hypothetical protein
VSPPWRIEAASAQNLLQLDLAEVGFDELGVGVQADDDLARCIALFGRGCADLVEDHDVGELDLLNQEIDDGAIVPLPGDFTAVGQEIR